MPRQSPRRSIVAATVQPLFGTAKNVRRWTTRGSMVSKRASAVKRGATLRLINVTSQLRELLQSPSLTGSCTRRTTIKAETPKRSPDPTEANHHRIFVARDDREFRTKVTSKS